MRIIIAGIFCLLSLFVRAQQEPDAWMIEQLGDIQWQEVYAGVLADYHPLQIILASDKKEVAGYLIQSDGQHHRLIGEWSDNGLFQLQEQDSLGRLTGYLTGQIKKDQLALKWLSLDQSRIFDIYATTEQLINISSKAPTAEWIKIEADPSISISVQKIGNGLVAGFVLVKGKYIRFEGQCLDGSCSIWKATFRNAEGDKTTMQLRQNAIKTYKATIGASDYVAKIIYTYPLEIKHVDQFSGFIDLVLPKLKSAAYNEWVETFWSADEKKLSVLGNNEAASRLSFRSSGWVEIISETESAISGWITFMHPDGCQREAFLISKKDGEMLKAEELLNTPNSKIQGAEMALAASDDSNDTFYQWIEEAGFEILLPTQLGVVMATTFSTVYGDELKLLSMEESKLLIKKKYWKLFGW